MVSVRKRGKVYEYRFEIATVEGTRKWITKSGYPTKAEAFKEGAKAYNDFYYNGQKTQLRENMSYADFLDYWIDNYASFNLHYSTTISYINIIKNHVKPRVGFYKLWQLDTRLLQEFINKIYVEYGFSKNYMASILKVVKGSLKYACYTLNYINTNPAEHVHAPRIDKIGKDPAHIFTQEEIERILQELSAMVGEVSEDLISNQEILGRLDFAFAKGKLSMKMRGVEPTLNKDKFINIKNGRHPLLDRKTVVPNSVYLGRDFHTLVITGPNTGGKTVTIKTVGLFALMTQSGLHISADYGSSMCVYDNIFADIGDEQSIEQSLSTFSSHMTNIVSILKDVTENSLVIFDELGAGTDPIEGAALAIAILEDVAMAGARCIATTHYTEIKNYALTKDGVENAAVEFDLDTLSPTYKLLIGVPGKSNAFEISKKLGLSDYIITRAKEFIDTDNIELEDILQSAEKNRIKAEEERIKAEKLRESIEKLKIEYDEKLEKFANQKEKMLEQARQEAFRITRQAKEEVDNIIKEDKNRAKKYLNEVTGER